ncbi:MAG: hypothetical protein QNJ98_16235 [Planctomycetota bacterium]|nr:hypothetical protein [Planctomycetota bacterium]
MPRVVAPLALLALLLVPALGFAEDEKKKRKPPPPPPPGIWWAKGFDSGMLQAAREGRPILFCINALDTESANLRLRGQAYKSTAWGEASRGYVAFPCHPGSENGPDGNSTRYVGTPAKTANDALNYILKRFGQSQISPQHIILEPDGDVAFRKEYYTGVVSPHLLRTYLSVVSPPIAFTRASIDREDAINALAEAPTEELDQRVRSYLGQGDGYAGAVVLNLLEDEFDKARRLILIKALEKLPKRQLPVAAYGADERISWPDDEPAETEAWIKTLLVIDRKVGARAAARAVARSEEAALRTKLLAAWDPYGAEESLRATEASLLSGHRKKTKSAPDDDDPMAWRMARAEQKAGLKERRWPELEKAFGDGRPAIVRGALMEADAEDVMANAPFIEEALIRPRVNRVRIAAALALLRSGKARDARRVSAVVINAVFDVVEGPEARAHAVESLGDDPGDTTEGWAQAIDARLKGGGR